MKKLVEKIVKWSWDWNIAQKAAVCFVIGLSCLLVIFGTMAAVGGIISLIFGLSFWPSVGWAAISLIAVFGIGALGFALLVVFDGDAIV